MRQCVTVISIRSRKRAAVDNTVDYKAVTLPVAVFLCAHTHFMKSLIFREFALDVYTDI